MNQRQGIHRYLIIAMGVIVHTSILLAPLAIFNRLTPAVYSMAGATFIVLTTLFFLCEALASTPGSAYWTQSPNPLHPIVSGIGLLFVFWTGIWNVASSPPFYWGLYGTGVLLMTIGILLRLTAMRTLKNCFISQAAIRTNHALTTHGIYSYVRHPSETGLLCIAVGACTLLHSWVAVVLTIGLGIPSSLLRIKEENQLLRTTFNNDFRTYEETVKQLVPYVF